MKYILAAASLISCTQTFAQQKNIDTIVFKVSEQYKPIVVNAAKLNDAPLVADTLKPVRKVNYKPISDIFGTSFTPQPLQAVQLKGEPLDKLQHSLLNIGAGNYSTLYTEYFYNALRSRDYDYGIHLNHLSSVATLSNSGYSSYAYNDVNLYGKVFFPKHTLYVQADYDEQIVHDYGYNTTENIIKDNDLTRQRFNLFAGMVQYISHLKDSSAINHDLELGYYNFSSLYNVAENNFDVNAHVFTYIQHQRLDIKAFAHYYDNKDAITNSTTTNLLFNPYFSTIENHWDAHIGFKTYYDAANKFYIFPDLLIRYHAVPDVFGIYAGIDGGKEYNSLKSIAAANPYIQDTLTHLYTLTMYHLFAGVSGNITSQLTYNVNASQCQLKNMPLFVTDTLEPLRNRFMVVYDNVKVLNAHIDIGYEMNKAMSFNLGADYYQYTPTYQLKAWYHPALKINLNAKYAIQEKYIVSAEIYILGSQYAPAFSAGQLTAKQLAGYPDINLGFDYKRNKFLTAFIHLNNIANVAYYRWDNYPTQGFNLLAGVRLAF